MKCSSCGQDFEPQIKGNTRCIECLKRSSGRIEISGTFEVSKMSPEFHKWIWGELPLVSTPEEANRYGLTKDELAKKR